ncbi:unnamed protein product [Caenorhabditis nigoni]|uniref:Uncharacterized protein n=1 Tax=Caenorhabditis nigoni TaxID=1611254 RepID=A0A2G5T0K5_9PELO|nr:hypothetical protein B9Z55_025944 [Caenorhabditis nigoni]
MDSATPLSHEMQILDGLIEPHLQTLEEKSHWPTWAMILVVVCIILSLLAFFLGNFITKKTTSVRNKSSTRPDGKERERKWGAGFSGGLWAAA